MVSVGTVDVIKRINAQSVTTPVYSLNAMKIPENVKIYINPAPNLAIKIQIALTETNVLEIPASIISVYIRLKTVMIMIHAQTIVVTHVLENASTLLKIAMIMIPVRTIVVIHILGNASTLPKIAMIMTPVLTIVVTHVLGNASILPKIVMMKMNVRKIAVIDGENVNIIRFLTAHLLHLHLLLFSAMKTVTVKVLIVA